MLLLGIAKANFELENYGSVKETYQELQEVSPALAEKYAYLIAGEEATARASALGIKEVVEWDEE